MEGLGGGRGRGEGGRTPMQKAPPKSLRATQGQGSREWSIVVSGEGGGEAGGNGGGGGGVRRVGIDEARGVTKAARKVYTVGVGKIRICEFAEKLVVFFTLPMEEDDDVELFGLGLKIFRVLRPSAKVPRAFAALSWRVLFAIHCAPICMLHEIR